MEPEVPETVEVSLPLASVDIPEPEEQTEPEVEVESYPDAVEEEVLIPEEEVAEPEALSPLEVALRALERYAREKVVLVESVSPQEPVCNGNAPKNSDAGSNSAFRGIAETSDEAQPDVTESGLASRNGSAIEPEKTIVPRVSSLGRPPSSHGSVDAILVPRVSSLSRPPSNGSDMNVHVLPPRGSSLPLSSRTSTDSAGPIASRLRTDSGVASDGIPSPPESPKSTGSRSSSRDGSLRSHGSRRISSGKLVAMPSPNASILLEVIEEEETASASNTEEAVVPPSSTPPPAPLDKDIPSPTLEKQLPAAPPRSKLRRKPTEIRGKVPLPTPATSEIVFPSPIDIDLPVAQPILSTSLLVELGLIPGDSEKDPAIQWIDEAVKEKDSANDSPQPATSTVLGVTASSKALPQVPSTWIHIPKAMAESEKFVFNSPRIFKVLLRSKEAKALQQQRETKGKRLPSGQKK